MGTREGARMQERISGFLNQQRGGGGLQGPQVRGGVHLTPPDTPTADPPRGAAGRCKGPKYGVVSSPCPPPRERM